MPETNGRSDHVVGVDLGGTKIYAGIFDGKMSMVGATKFSTKPQRGSEVVIDRIARGGIACRGRNRPHDVTGRRPPVRLRQ